MSTDDMTRLLKERIRKHDAQLHYCGFLGYVRLFQNKTIEDVESFTTEFWQLVEKHFGKRAIQRYWRTYP